jgi:hypothetical protein
VIHTLLMIFAYLVAAALAIVLWAAAGLHAYWGQGGFWPERDETSLARRVVGAPDIQTMPSPAACYAVAIPLFLAGAWPLAMVGLLPMLLPAELMVLAGWGLALVFLGRGVAAYTEPFRQLFPEEPFATLDRGLYGPLCLFMGLGFLYLLILGWITP